MRQHKIFSTLLAFDRWIIGVNDKMEENVWRYNSGGTIPFNLPWSNGSPSNSGNEDCVEVGNTKVWNDIPCTHSSGKFFIRSMEFDRSFSQGSHCSTALIPIIA